MGNRSVKVEVAGSNKRLVEDFETILVKEIPISERGVILDTLLPGGQSEKFRKGTPFPELQVQSIKQQAVCLADIYHWVHSLEKIKKSKLMPFSREDFLQFEESFDTNDYSEAFAEFQALEEKHKVGTEGLHDLEARKDAQALKNHTTILKFLEGKGYTSDLFSPSFREQICSEDLKSKSVQEVLDLVREQITLIYTFHYVLNNSAPILPISLGEFSTLDALRSAVERAGVPDYLLPVEYNNMQALDDLTDSLKESIYRIVNLSVDIDFLLKKPPLPFFDISGSLNKNAAKPLLGFFSLGWVGQTLAEGHPFAELPFCRIKDRTLQFFFPKPSPCFVLRSSGKEDMFHELQSFFNLYFFFILYREQAELGKQSKVLEKLSSSVPPPVPTSKPPAPRSRLPQKKPPVPSLPQAQRGPSLVASVKDDGNVPTQNIPPSFPAPAIPKSEPPRPPARRAPASRSSLGNNSRAGLLSQIKGGARLRAVAPPEEDPKKRLLRLQKQQAAAGDNRAALAAALSRRASQMHRDRK